MTRFLLAVAAVSALALVPALAQTGSPSPGRPGMVPGESRNGPASDATAMPGPLGTPTTIERQSPDQWLASKFKGTQVIGSDDARIGAVEDVLFDRSGSVKALLVGVGGFLGIGSKQVAFSMPTFRIVPGKDGGAEQLRLPMTKAQVAAAPEFKPYEPPRTAAGGSPRPTTSGAAPATSGRPQ